MKIRIWGARGSIPSPLKLDQVEEKIIQAILGLPKGLDTGEENTVREYVAGLPPLARGTAGGNTPCVEVRAGGELFVLDAGSGIHQLGLELLEQEFGRGQGVMHLFISHPHWDHIQGFPMFMPAFVPGNRIFIYGAHNIRKALEEQQRPFNWPASLEDMQADLEFITLSTETPVKIGRVYVDLIQNNHSGDSYSYRLRDQQSILVYATDSEYKQLDDDSVQPHIEFFRNADVLIFDAQYTLREAWHQKVDWGHSSSMIGVDLARAANVGNLLLFHHDPTYSDAELQEIQATAVAYQAQDAGRPACEVMVAYEGLVLDITPPSAVDFQLTLDGEAAILTPVSVFDERGVDQLVQQLARLAKEQTPASSIIDLSQVETLTTASLKALVTVSQERDGSPIVLVGPSDSALEVIRLGGHLDYFAIYPTVEAALTAVQAREALNLPGQVIKDRYQIQNKVGEGRLGTVLQATDTNLDRPVAIKVLSPSFSEQTLARFMRQACQVVNLEHPNIARVFDWNREEGYSFKVEEFIKGPALQDILERGNGMLPADQVMRVALSVTRALEYAHSWGVIHGDLKPQNIFLTTEGVKLGGFGLGLLEEGRSLLEAPLILLTAAYLAPEQILGQPLDTRTDLYALGVILYQLYTGHLPFSGSDEAMMQAHLNQVSPSPRDLNPRVSLIMEHVILKLLAKSPDDRYISARQVRDVLKNLVFDARNVTAQQCEALLVGRDEALDTLKEFWDQARAGQGQLAFITGDSGMGKTSLACQAAVQSDPSVLLVGCCPASRGERPYQLFAEILRTYLAMTPYEQLESTDRQLLGNMAYLIPEVRQSLPELPQSTVLGPKQEQLRLMTSLTQFIDRAVHRQPWLIILDDLHWADQSSLELLSYLGRYLASMPLMVIGTYCDVDLDRSHPLRETLRDVSSHLTYGHFPLRALTQEEIGRVVAGIWMQPGPESLVARIYQHTGGNPLYAGEVARGLVDDGLVVLKDGEYQFPGLEDVRLPHDVREAIWRRIRHLDPDAQTLLRQASVLGQVFLLEDLRRMSELSIPEILENLDMALDRYLIQEMPGEPQLRFCHPEIQDVLYADLGPPRRRLLHRQAGDAMEQRAAPRPESIAEELAHHFEEGGELEQAVVYSIEAARRAEAAYANGAALLWYTQALELLEQLGPDRASRFQSLRLSAHKSLGEVLAEIGQFDEALEHYASALFRWLGRGPSYVGEAEPTIELVRIYLFGAELYYRQSKYDEAVSWCQKSLDVASQIKTREGQQARGRACYLLGDICIRSGDLPYAAPFFRESLQVYREIDDLVGQATAYNSLGLAHYYQGDWSQSEEAYSKSLAISHEIGDVELEGQASNNLALIYVRRGEWERAKNFLEQSYTTWKQIGAAKSEASILNNMALLHIYQGDWDEAHSCLSRSQSIFAEVGSDEYLPELERRWGELLRRTGELDQALDHALRSVELAVEQGNLLEEGMSCRVLGRIHVTKKEWEPAEAALSQSLEILSELDSKYEIAVTKLELAHLLVGSDPDEQEQARAYLSQAKQVLERLGAAVKLADVEALEQLVSG